MHRVFALTGAIPRPWLVVETAGGRAVIPPREVVEDDEDPNVTRLLRPHHALIAGQAVVEQVRALLLGDLLHKPAAIHRGRYGVEQLLALGGRGAVERIRERLAEQLRLRLPQNAASLVGHSTVRVGGLSVNRDEVQDGAVRQLERVNHAVAVHDLILPHHRAGGVLGEVELLLDELQRKVAVITDLNRHRCIGPGGDCAHQENGGDDAEDGSGRHGCTHVHWPPLAALLLLTAPQPESTADRVSRRPARVIALVTGRSRSCGSGISHAILRKQSMPVNRRRFRAASPSEPAAAPIPPCERIIRRDPRPPARANAA